MRGDGEQQAARLGTGKAQRGAAVFHRQAAGGHAFVRRARSVGRHHVDALVADIKFIGGNLRQRGKDALTKFAFAGVDGDFAVGVDAYPAIEHAVIVQAAREWYERRACRLLRDSQWFDQSSETECRNDGAALLQKSAAGELGSVHVQAPFTAMPAARCTARTTRLCVPQRHKLAASACLICASVGLGFTSSNALADIIMPLVQ